MIRVRCKLYFPYQNTFVKSFHEALILMKFDLISLILLDNEFNYLCG